MHTERMLKPGIMLRAYFMLQGLSVWGFGIFDKGSTIYMVAHQPQHITLYSMWAILVLALIGIFDITINDLMPDKYKYRSALCHRHITYMFLSICLAVQMFSIVKNGFNHWLLLYYGLFAISLPVIALYDIISRFKYKTNERRESKL